MREGSRKEEEGGRKSKMRGEGWGDDGRIRMIERRGKDEKRKRRKTEG